MPMSDQETSVRVKKKTDRSAEGYTADERKELRRSWVRVWVTYAAAVYLFILGPFAAWMVFSSTSIDIAEGSQSISILAPNVAAGKDVFLAILPIATGIVTYWFATRRN